MDATINEFIGHLRTERGLSVNTLAAYGSDLTQFLGFIRARGQLRWDVPAALVRAFMTDLIQREYQSSSQARKLAAVKALYRYLVASGQVAHDPTAGLGGARVRKRRPRIISAAEVGRLLEQAALERTPEGLRDSAMLEALYATGMRVSELVALNMADLDPERRVLMLARAQARARTVSISERAVFALQAYVTDGRSKLLRRVNEQAMFLNHRGNRLTRQGFWLIIKAHARRAKITTPITPHTLRHSYATHRLRARGNVHELQITLGHASSATTQIYAELAREQPDDGPAQLAST